LGARKPSHRTFSRRHTDQDHGTDRRARQHDRLLIPSKSNRRFPAELDRHTCKWRHLIENLAGKLKEYRGDRDALL
jgi:hypothetical protein